MQSRNDVDEFHVGSYTEFRYHLVTPWRARNILLFICIAFFSRLSLRCDNDDDDDNSCATVKCRHTAYCEYNKLPMKSLVVWPFAQRLFTKRKRKKPLFTDLLMCVLRSWRYHVQTILSYAPHTQITQYRTDAHDLSLRM